LFKNIVNLLNLALSCNITGVRKGERQRKKFKMNNKFTFLVLWKLLGCSRAKPTCTVLAQHLNHEPGFKTENLIK